MSSHEPEPPWVADSACASVGPGPWDHDAPAEARATACRVCAGCPVRAECLAFGIAERLSGVFGGELLDDGQDAETIRERRARHAAAARERQRLAA